MIKSIKSGNILLTPFYAVKNWELTNTNPQDLLVTEPFGSTPSMPIAMEYIDYSSGVPVTNSFCNIAMEQQSTDLVKYQEGLSGSGHFYPYNEPTNNDGTYKRLVHSQIKATFYNNYNNPLQLYGVENIDLNSGNTYRALQDRLRIFTIPRMVFGERVMENSIRLYDTTVDDNVTISDDGYQNLTAGYNLFSKIQTVGFFPNNILPGTSSYNWS